MFGERIELGFLDLALVFFGPTGIVEQESAQLIQLIRTELLMRHHYIIEIANVLID
jgi:hypothetical protein